MESSAQAVNRILKALDKKRVAPETREMMLVAWADGHKTGFTDGIAAEGKARDDAVGAIEDAYTKL